MQKLCCAILGHSPMRFAWGFDEEDYKCGELKLELVQQIMELRVRDNVTQFMVACDCGVGLYAAEALNVLREKDDDVKLICVTPHEEQATKWAPYLRERYFTMLEQCTHMEAISAQKTPTCQYDAFVRIIDSSDVVLAIYDPDSFRGDDVDKAMQYAVRQRKRIILIHPDTFEIISGTPKL